ncbi:MAG: hypothetical protein HYY84_08540 [Deltaproteobacteria bacterium]|nr:hypothetical protein [Deltaproteobacteria bacterium]
MFAFWASLLGAVPFDIDGFAWDGMSEVAAMARALGVRLEVGRATPGDEALFILFPTTRVDAVALAGHRPNARFAVFDDFGGELVAAGPRDGRGDAVWADFFWHGIRDLPVARARRAHPTTTGVREVVMNRPAPESSRSSWQSASAILEFASGSVAAIASGNLVLGADPSLFVNRMLAFGDNRRFAENVLRWLSLDGRAPVKLVVGDAARGIALLHRPSVRGTSWTRPLGEVLTDLNLELGRRAEPVWVVSVVLAILVFVLAAVVASRWVRTRGGTTRKSAGDGAAGNRLSVEIEDAWFDLSVRLQNVRRAEWMKGLGMPSQGAIGKRIGMKPARVEAAHAILDRLERLPRVERLLPPAVGVASRRAGVDRR